MGTLWAFGLLAEGEAGQKPPAAELDLEQLVEVRVRVATGHPQPLSRAPAVASVITRQEIEELGVSSVDEVLERLPGVHVLPSRTRGLDPVYSIRGIQTPDNSQVLMLLDGVPLTSLNTGGPPIGLSMPVAGIEQIEVVRGPGSVVFGADAFAGVINIVTEPSSHGNGTEFGIGMGSFGTQRGWLTSRSQGQTWGYRLSADWRRTDGDDGRLVPADQQTLIDALLRTSASLAPAALSTDREQAGIRFSLFKGPFQGRLWVWGVQRGVGEGAAQALDPRGQQETSLALADIEWRGMSAGWEWSQRFAYYHLDQGAFFRLFPPGALLPIAADGNVSFTNPVGLVLFTDGLLGKPGVREQTLRYEAVGLFKGAKRHVTRLAAGAVTERVEARERKNFGPGVLNGRERVVDGALTDVTGTALVFLPTTSGDHWYLSAQDVVQLGDWSITAGARYDDYSQFGSTFIPRLAVVWSLKPKTSLKLLYGRAFRRPSFGQLFTVNNPATLGNPDLEPEMIDTYELAVSFQPSGRLRGSLNLFRYDADGLIVPSPSPSGETFITRNAESRNGEGFEVELWGRPHRLVDLAGSLSLQESRNDATGEVAQDSPRFQGRIAIDVHPNDAWHCHLEVRRVADRPRAPSDPRPPIADYSIVDLRLGRRLTPRFTVALIGKNVLDTMAYEPSPPQIPGDIPLPGQSWLIELRMKAR